MNRPRLMVIIQHTSQESLILIFRPGFKDILKFPQKKVRPKEINATNSESETALRNQLIKNTAFDWSFTLFTIFIHFFVSSQTLTAACATVNGGTPLDQPLDIY